MLSLNALVPSRNNKSEVPTRREEVFDPFLNFRREVDRMFDRFFDGFAMRSTEEWHGIIPAVDIDETDKEMVITAELPGVSDKDIEVSMAGDVLTIKGEKKTQHEEKNGNSYYMERRFGSFSRSVRLPFEIGEEKVDANFKNGVLTIHLPKPAQLQRSVRKIDVKGY